MPKINPSGGISSRVSVSPEQMVDIFRAISNFAKVFNRIELARLAQKFELSFEDIAALAGEWVSAGIIFGQVIGRELVITKINIDEAQIRQMLLGAPAPSPVQSSTSHLIDVQVATPSPSPTQTHAPVVFDDTADKTQEIQEKYIATNVDLSYLAGFARLKFTIENGSSAQITDIIVKLTYPKTLRVVQVKPAQFLKRLDAQLIITLPVIPAKKGVGILFFFKPSVLDKYVLKAAIQFTNARSFVRMVTVDSLQFDTSAPQMEPGPSVPSDYIEKFVQTHETRGIRSFALPTTTNSTVIFVQIKQILKASNFQLISEANTDQMLSAWFLAKEAGTNHEYVAAGQIFNQKIEFFVAGEDEKLIINLLTDLTQKLRERMLSSHILNDPEEFLELMCPKCGGTLEFLPKIGDNVTCKWCHESFTFNPGANPA